MMRSLFICRLTTAILLCAIAAPAAFGAPLEPVLTLAAREKAPLLGTLKDLVSIESGSGDREGLDRIANLIATRLQALGGRVEQIEAGADTYRMFDTPKQIGKMVLARFTGSGTKKILLIAHMDTVYLRGMLAQQPFRIDGNRAYGLGISDDKHGIAVILHTLAILRQMNFRDYGELTVLINGDEEISSPGSRAMLTRLGAEPDAVLSFESSPVAADRWSWSPPASAPSSSRSKAAPHMQAPRLSRAATRSTSYPIRSCRRATCRMRPLASR